MIPEHTHTHTHTHHYLLLSLPEHLAMKLSTHQTTLLGVCQNTYKANDQTSDNLT